MQTSADSVTIDSPQPEVVPVRMHSSRLSAATQVVMIAMFMLATLFGYGRWRTGSSDLVWPWLMDRQLVFSPAQFELGNVSPNQLIEEQIRVSNVSSRPLSIIGSQKSCGCIGLDEFPIEIAAGESQKLRIKIMAAKTAGKFEHHVKFFTNSSSGNVEVVTVAGIVD